MIRNCPILHRLISGLVIRLDSSRYAGVLIRSHGEALFVNDAVEDTGHDIQPGGWLVLDSFEVGSILRTSGRVGGYTW